MYHSKISLLFVFLAFIACQDTTSTNKATSAKEQPTKEASTISVAASAKSETPSTKAIPNPVEKPAVTIKEVEKEIKTAATPQKQTEQPVAKKVNIATTVQKEAKKKVPTTKVATQPKVTTPEAKIVEAKEKITEAAKEVIPTPPTTVKQPTQPKIVATSTTSSKEKVVENIPKKEKVAPKKELDHTLWDGLLRKYVSATGKVNYKGLKADTNFETYLQLLKDNPLQNSWSRNKKMAYWINAYNAFTIKLIADNYPVSSITKLHGGKPWDHKWIKLGDKTYTLNDIEHKILRPQFKDARIHFAVNCAAASCPPVLNRAWTAKNLNSNLEKQTKIFINNPAFNSISSKQIELSKIFEWYKEDFGDLITYINKYADTKVKAGAKVAFKEYDWALNE